MGATVYTASTQPDPQRARLRGVTDKRLNSLRKTGAGDRFRTGDLVLGKHTLYQLSYTRSQAIDSEPAFLSARRADVKSRPA
jgi:hypothetical protein